MQEQEVEDEGIVSSEMNEEIMDVVNICYKWYS